jgi:hypothetical protein
MSKHLIVMVTSASINDSILFSLLVWNSQKPQHIAPYRAKPAIVAPAEYDLWIRVAAISIERWID